MNGWNDDLMSWPQQCFARTLHDGRSYLLYLRNRGAWQGWIIEGFEMFSNRTRPIIWSDEILHGCRVKDLDQAKLALVRIFKHSMGIRHRVELIRPNLI